MSQIFIGYILVFFNIGINGFDLLPDFIGYALIFVGLGRLATESENFAKARPWALGMSLWCVVAVLLSSFVIWGYAADLLWAVAVNFVMLYIQYLTVCGISDLEKLVGRDLGSQSLLQMWKVIALSCMTALVLMYIPNYFSVLLGALLIVVMFVAQIFFLVYFYKAKGLYAAARG